MWCMIWYAHLLFRSGTYIGDMVTSKEVKRAVNSESLGIFIKKVFILICDDISLAIDIFIRVGLYTIFSLLLVLHSPFTEYLHKIWSTLIPSIIVASFSPPVCLSVCLLVYIGSFCVYG